MKIITKRFVLHVGYSCNLRCRFCYYRESLEKGDVKDLALSEIKSRLRIARKLKKEEVDLSGGEATIRKDLPEIIQYAKSIGYQTVCIITNGFRMSDLEYCKELKDAGLNDVLFSLHSPKEEIHDYLTKVRGSWQRLRKAMENLNELQLRFRINTVVNNLNFNDLEDYFSYIQPLKPRAVNLLIHNPAEECMSYGDEEVTIADYHAIGKSVSYALDKYSDEFGQINVRFFPFCLLKGHEDKIRTMWQKIYEREEWDPVLFMKFRKNNIFLFLAFLYGFLFCLDGQVFYGKKNIYTLICEIVQSGRIHFNNTKISLCRQCAMRKMCPGLPKAFIKKYGEVKLSPYPGDIVKDPLAFFDAHLTKC